MVLFERKYFKLQLHNKFMKKAKGKYTKAQLKRMRIKWLKKARAAKKKKDKERGGNKIIGRWGRGYARRG